MTFSKPLTTCASWWMKSDPIACRFEALSGHHSTEVLVIGGGITGLTTAIELVERGHVVTVCEAQAIGAGTTTGSSAHLDAHPEIMPRKLIETLGLEDAIVYTALRLAAIDGIEKRSAGEADFARVPAYQYSEDADDESDLRKNMDAARQLGLSVSWCDEVPISGAACGYRIANMARFDCRKYLARLVDVAVDLGVTIFEKTLVAGPTEKHAKSLSAGNGDVKFEHVVCATHCSFTSGNLLYAATPPYQSYIVVAKVRRPPDDALYWDNSDPYYYVRRVGEDHESLILVGGCDHRTGTGDSVKAMECVEDWTHEHFEVELIVKRWSAEFFEPTDGLPMIGLGPGKKNVWVATGLSGVGLTLGTAAATLITDGIEGKKFSLEDAFSPSRMALSKDWLVEQASAAANIAERILPASSVNVEALDDGEGQVGKVDGQHVAVCRDVNGCVHKLDPICPHMGGVLHWNEAEQTWDCPLHGGRFTADGKRLYGPPESDLSTVS